MTRERISGRCLCGAISFEVDADPQSVTFCHCESCRRHSGSPAAAFIGVPKAVVSWCGPERASYRSSPEVIRSFCGRCGSSLTYEHDASPERTALYVGSLDDPSRYTVGKHVHYGERVTWFDTIDSAPRYRAGSNSEELPVATEAVGSTEPKLAIGPIPPIAGS